MGGHSAVAANYTLTATDAPGASSFNAQGNFAANPATDGGVDTFNTSGFTLRTPAGTGSYTFGGASLEVDAGGRLLGKSTGNASTGSTITVANLILNGGFVDEANSSGDGSILNLAGTVTVNAASGLGALPGETLVVGSTVNGSSGLTIAGTLDPGDTGTVVFTGTAGNYSGTTNVAGGTLVIGNGGTGGSLGAGNVLLTGTLAFNQSAAVSLANAITGTGALTKLGGNTLTLTAADTIGGLFVRGGTLTTTSTITASSFASIGLSPGDNGTLTLPAGASYANGTNDFNVADQGGATAATANNGTVNLTGGTLAVGTLYIGKGTSVTAANAVGLFNMTSGTLTASNGGLRVAAYGTGTFNQTGGTATVTAGFTSIGLNNGSTGVYNLLGGTFTDAATLDVNVGDSGTGVLNIGGGSGTASFNASLGTFYIARQATAVGTVNLLANGLLIIPGIGTNLGGTSTFNFNGGQLVATNNSTGFLAGAATVNVLANRAQIQTNGFNVTIGSNISSGVTNGTDGGVTVLGPGVLTLAGNNSYTGTTQVVSGELRVNNTAGSGSGAGPVFVTNVQSILGGTGTIAGPVVVGSGGTITAGPNGSSGSVGTLTTGAQYWQSGGTLLNKFSGTNSANDTLVMSGVTVTGPFTVNVTGANVSSAAGTFTLAVDTGAKYVATPNPFNTSSLSLQVNGSAPPSGFTLAERSDPSAAFAGDVDLVLVAAPEPTSLLLLTAVAAPLAVGRRRRPATVA